MNDTNDMERLIKEYSEKMMREYNKPQKPEKIIIETKASVPQHEINSITKPDETDILETKTLSYSELFADIVWATDVAARLLNENDDTIKTVISYFYMANEKLALEIKNALEEYKTA